LARAPSVRYDRILVSRLHIVTAAALLLGCPSREQEATPPPEADASVEPENAPADAAAAASTAPVVPVVVPAATAAHLAVQTKMRGEPLAEAPLVHFVPVEDPSGRALARFHGALRALHAGEDPDGKVRVAVYGASSTSNDRFTAYLRGYLQHRFGDAGAGFVTLVPLWKWHRHNAVSVKASKHWFIEHAQRKKGRLDGLYGLIGASASASDEKAWAELRPTTARNNTDAALSDVLELYWLGAPQGGSFDVKLRDQVVTTVRTRSDAVGPGYTEIPAPAKRFPLRIQARGDGEVRLFGAVLERDAKGVVVDELGVGGTRAANMLDWNDAVWRDNLARRSPDLVVLAYGANESVDEDEPIETYRANLDAVLQRVAAAAPGASCVLVGPQDFPMKDEEGNRVARPRIGEIIESQRTVAAARGCGFFDLRAMMGGEGGMLAWVVADPPLGKGDHLHFTPLGYVHLGRVLSDALMVEFDRGT
jgi:lysophospholipase L1-like esterase